MINVEFKTIIDELNRQNIPLYICSDSKKKIDEFISTMTNYIVDYANKKIVHILCDEFIKDCCDYEKINNKYTNADVLILENIDKLEGLCNEQKRLLFVYTKLHKLNKQMIFTSNKNIDKLKIDKRLKDRLNLGLSVNV